MSSEKTGSVRRLAYLGFSLLVTIGIFSYLFTHVSPGEVLDVIRGADRRGILMFLILSLSMSVFRTWRYRLVLKTSGFAPSSPALFLVVIVRNFFSDLLPARIGTLVYVYIVTTRLGVPFGAATSSFALSFLFDLIALAPMIAIAAFAAGAATGLSAPVLIAGGGILAVVTVVILFALPKLFHLAGWFIARIVDLTRGRLQSWNEAWANAEKDIQLARESGIYGRMLVLSLLVRVCKYGSLYVFLFALIGPLGYGFAKLSVPRVFLGLCSSELAASLPISGIAGFGAYEGTWAVIFEMLGFPGHIAKLTSVSHHLFTQVYGYSLGALCLIVLMLPFFRGEGMLPKQEYVQRSAWSFYALVLVAVLVIALLLISAYSLSVGMAT